MKIINSLRLLFAVVLCCLLISCNSDVNSKDNESFDVLSVVDGDTFIIDDRHKSRVRMLGIDTPEILTDYGPGEPFSKQAREFLKDRINNRRVRLEYGVEKFDPYGRILAYVFLEDAFLNEELLEAGLARTFIFKEKQKYNEQLRKAESRAKKSKTGIWSSLSDFDYELGNKEFFIKPVSAKRYVDQRVITRGKITGSRENKKVVVLKIDDDLDIVIFKDNLSNFKHFGINPQNYYTGHLVEVIGKVTVYRGRTQIAVHHPLSMRKLQ